MQAPTTLQATHTLKQLQTRRSQLQAELETRRKAAAEAQRIANTTQQMLTATEAEITALEESSAEPIVSEHAMLRYLQHVHGLDLEALKQEMLPEQLVTQINTLGSGRLPSAKGTHLVVKKRVVITVIPPETTTAQSPKKKNAQASGPKPAQRRREQDDNE